MDTTRNEASADTEAAAFDSLTRSLHGRLPRRRAVRLLAAALATTWPKPTTTAIASR
jgi:hypothetical protein